MLREPANVKLLKEIPDIIAQNFPSRLRLTDVTRLNFFEVARAGLVH